MQRYVKTLRRGGVVRELPTLQGVRAVAAVAVVCHHAFRAVTIYRSADIALPASAYWPAERWVNLGASGVDVFFVLSGFLMVYIAGPYLRGERSAGDFLLKRFVRIWPLYAFFTLLAIAEAVVKGYRTGTLPFDLAPLRLASLIFVPSINENGQVAPIVGIGWTLTYEAFYYLCFAVVLRSARRRPVVVLAALLAVMYIAGLAGPTTAVGRFLHNDIVFEFLFGAGIARLMLERRIWPSFGWAWIGGGIALLVAFAFVPTLGLPRLLTGGVPAALLLVGALALDRVASVPRWLVGLGNASYALYLSHIFIVAHAPNMVLRILSRHGPATHAVVLSAILTVALCVAVGMVVHRLIEKPLLRLVSRLANGATRRADPPSMVATDGPP